MEPVAVWRDLLRAGEAAGWAPGRPLPPAFLPWFLHTCYEPHKEYFDGLEETYGREFWGSQGLTGHLLAHGQRLLEATARIAASHDLAADVAALLARSTPLLPGPPPRVYVAPLFFLAPAATVSVGGRPAMAIAPERFAPHPLPPEPVKFTYAPAELVEMVPHEACHVARMEALGLPPTPRALSLLEMVMLEGTALVFADQITGRTTLRTFLPQERMAWHEAHDDAVIAHAVREFDQAGMPVFLRYFAADSPVSGYYVGYSLCRKYLDTFGPGTLPELVTMPSLAILRRLATRA
jgi:hypothetical protein